MLAVCNLLSKFDYTLTGARDREGSSTSAYKGPRCDKRGPGAHNNRQRDLDHKLFVNSGRASSTIAGL